MNLLKLEQRCIWILGASSGIGFALTEALLEKGNYIIASARNLESLKKLQVDYPLHLKLLPVDLTDTTTLNSLATQLHKHTDYLDSVIYSAGTCEYTDALSHNINAYEQSLQLNYLGVVHVFKHSLNHLKKSHHKPQFAAISSLTTELGFPRAAAYGAGKAALNYFMESLRVDLINTPIQFSLVQPGFVATRMTKKNDFAMPFIMSAKESASIIIKGMEKGKFYIRFPHRLLWSLQLLRLASRIKFSWLAKKMSRIHHW